METLRADSPAIRLLAAVLQRPAIVALQHDLIINAVAATTAAVEIGGNPTSDVACVGPFLHQLVAMIKGILESPAPELVAVLRALQHGNAGHLALSFLCLRCFAPSLAVPGSDVPEAVQAHLRVAAKALQLVANDVEPKEDSHLYPLRAVLKVCLSRGDCSDFYSFFNLVGVQQHSPASYLECIAEKRYSSSSNQVFVGFIHETLHNALQSTRVVSGRNCSCSPF